MSEWVPGRNPVREALRSRRVEIQEVLVSETAEGQVIDEVLEASARGEIPVHRVPGSQLNDRADVRGHQGVLARVVEFPLTTLDELLGEMPTDQWLRLVILDQVQDPVNLGNLARSSLFFGCQGLVKTRDRTSPVTPTAVKSSAGALLRLPVVEVTNLRRALQRLQEARFWMVGLLAEGDRSVDELPRDRNLALVLGNEETGLRRLTREECDFLVTIPGSGQFESLNVATAGAVASYALRAPPVDPGE